jgi:hypothetical protein
MWNGLVGPDDHAWNSGASALATGWFVPEVVTADPETREQIRELVQRVYALGARAGNTSDPRARAELYGEFLSTCIDCHRLTSTTIR